MKKIPGTTIKASDLPTYEWNADLIAFDGPVLSLYKGADGSEAFYLWLDCNEKRHRWAVLPVESEAVEGYLARQYSLLQIVQWANSIVVFDYDGQKRTNIVRTSCESLPVEYLPKEDSFLTPSIATQDAIRLAHEQTLTYTIKLDKRMFFAELGRIPYLFEQLYAFHYGLAHLAREVVQATFISNVQSWTSGLRSVQLFHGLMGIIPSFHQPKVRTMQYASPGHIELQLLTEIVGEIYSTASHINTESKYRTAKRLYADIYTYMRSESISGFDKDTNYKASSLTTQQTETLRSFVESFVKVLGWTNYQNALDQMGASPLLQLRAILSYFRRLDELNKFIQSGVIKLTDPHERVSHADHVGTA